MQFAGHFAQLQKNDANIISSAVLSIHLTSPSCRYNLKHVEKVRKIQIGI